MLQGAARAEGCFSWKGSICHTSSMVRGAHRPTHLENTHPTLLLTSPTNSRQLTTRLYAGAGFRCGDDYFPYDLLDNNFPYDSMVSRRLASLAVAKILL